MNNPFIKPASAYKRDLNFLGGYVQDMALYLARMTGDPLESCLDFVRKETSPTGQHAFKNPTVDCFTRQRNGDRKRTQISYTEYLKDIVENRRLFAPSLTVYVHPDEKTSVLAQYIEGNIAGRAIVKKEGIEAELTGNLELAAQKENEQTTYKIANNSLSGGQSSPHTILFNKTAHSALTSTCRSATSYGNANNEKFLCGNRHYWAPDVVKANIVSIARNTDLALLQEAVDFYGLVVPDVEQTVSVVEYSAQLYWRNPIQMRSIRRLIEGLTPIERAAFVYVGDMYHLAKYNDRVVRDFMRELSTRSRTPMASMEAAEAEIKSMDNDLKAFVSLLHAEDLRGKILKELRVSNPHGYACAAATSQNIREVLDRYRLMIESMWVTDNVPASVAYIRDSIRRSAVTSDTDSTIFTVQDWVTWYCGEMSFSEEAMAVDYAVVYLATQSIIHVLAKLSTNLGVIPEKLNVLAMKNEYAFPVFSLTPMAKHYYAYQAAREGSVFTKMKTEIKGVYLKDSNCPPAIMAEVENTICEIMDTVMAGQKISVNALYSKIGGIERNIYDAVARGESELLAQAPVNTRDSYSLKSPTTPYTHYELWQEVFAPTYGDAPPPPYRAVRVSLDINNRTDLNEWLDSLENQELAERMKNWLRKRGSVAISSLLLPQPVVELIGVPKEVIQAMNVRKLIYSTVKPFYLVLESLGIYMINQHNTRLVMDSLPPRLAAA